MGIDCVVMHHSKQPQSSFIISQNMLLDDSIELKANKHWV